MPDTPTPTPPTPPTPAVQTWPLFPAWDQVARPYAGDAMRWVVALVVGYRPEDRVTSPEEAAFSALRLTYDQDAPGTWWHVYDRQTGELHLFKQRDFVPDTSDVFGECAQCPQPAAWETAVLDGGLELPMRLCHACAAYHAAVRGPIHQLGDVPGEDNDPLGTEGERVPTILNSAASSWLSPGGLCQRCWNMIEWNGRGWTNIAGDTHCSLTTHGLADPPPLPRLPHVRFAPGVTHVKVDLDQSLRGGNADGYTNEKINTVFGHLSQVLGLWLACVWDYHDGDPDVGGNSDFYVIAPGGRIHELTGDLRAWLNEAPNSPDAPDTPGDPSTWIGPPTTMTTNHFAYDDGQHNFALRDTARESAVTERGF